MNRSRKPSRAIAAALIAAATAMTAVASAGPTVADETATTPDDGLAALKARVTHRIDLRLAALARLDRRVDRAEHLADEHRDTLSALIDQDVTELTELRTQVAEATTREELRADVESMVQDHRVLVLVLPQVRLTLVADRELAAIDRLGQVHDRLAELIEKAAADGRDTGNAAELLDAMQAQLDAAAAAVSGQVDRLLVIEPGPDAPAIRSAVDEVRESLRAARQDLRDAIAIARRIRAMLRHQAT
ncbi:MAG TPA: hypothetical protein VHO00_07875 [Actinomycetes bacterium]|nr:hypothetical protein [Actinomycetes bacterium]